MTQVRTTLQLLVLTTLMLVSAGAGSGAEPAPAAGTALVVVNASGPLTQDTADEIREIFLGKTLIYKNVALLPVQLGGPTRSLFLQRALGMSERDFQVYWMRKAYERGLLPPPVRATAADVLKEVGSQVGGIGFVDSASFRPISGVHVLYEIHEEGRR